MKVFDLSKSPAENQMVADALAAIRELLTADAGDLRSLAESSLDVEPAARQALQALARASAWSRRTADKVIAMGVESV